MNRGLLFYMPTVREWLDYNRTSLNDPTYASTTTYDGGFGGEVERNVSLPSNNNSPSGFYLLASYMPAMALSLTRPDLVWCVDRSLFDKLETRINVGSGYFVMEKCVLGPVVHYSDAAIDRRVSMFAETFATEVSNGVRWILQIYNTTNILQQHDLFGATLEVAKNIRNKLAYESYTPFQLVAELNHTSACDEMQVEKAPPRPFYRQQFGYASGAAAPVSGGLGQFTRTFPRPHLGASPIVGGFCVANEENVAVRDPYALRPDEAERLEQLIEKNREQTANKYYANIFRPSSGMNPYRRGTGHTAPTCGRGGRVGAGFGVAAKTFVDTATAAPSQPPPPGVFDYRPVEEVATQPPQPAPDRGMNLEDYTMDDMTSDAELMKAFAQSFH